MLRDIPVSVDIISREVTYRGQIWDIVKDVIALPDGVVTRDFLRHLGAVAVVAVNENNEILVIEQYRHPVGSQMVELPAGLLDMSGEEPAKAAARELLEETGYSANQWNVLVDICTTPGSSSETLRIFLATDLQAQSWSTENLTAEENQIKRHWVAMADAVSSILAGLWQNPTAVAGILAAKLATAESLRPADAPWPLRDANLETDRVFTF
jgi:8-oxo-dGTP pyrophosphatase MutT (NUDIX family)